MKVLIITFSIFMASLLQASEDKILMIAVDELSRDWISAYGSVNQTPNIDKLADNGLRFDTYWQTNIDKVQAEKNFLTGSYKGIGKPFPMVLKEAGYKTFYLGNANSKSFLINEKSILKSGLDFYSINSGEVNNIENLQDIPKFVLSCFTKPGKTFVMVRFAKFDLKSKRDYQNYLNEIDNFCKGISPLLSKSSKVNVIFTAICGSTIHEDMKVKIDKKSIRNPFVENPKLHKEKFVIKNRDICLPLIIKSPLIPETGLFTKDLTDGTDILYSILDLAGINIKSKGPYRSFKPAIRGDLDPRNKRNWIFCDAGGEKLIRSWEYVYYTNEKIYEIDSDPEQKMNLLVGKNNNKIYAGERVRLKMIYEREFLGKKPQMGELEKIETIQK